MIKHFYPRPISSNGFSHDAQVFDALVWIMDHHPGKSKEVLAKFPEVRRLKWTDLGTHIDTDAMGVDPEWVSWLTDAIEETGLVEWREGEPWALKMP